jgi:hypothetical protein
MVAGAGGFSMYGIIETATERIDIESEGGKRSTFRVSLPAAAALEGGMING